MLHSGKPVFTLYSSFFVTVYICLSLFFDPCCGVRVNYVLHPLTNGRRLCTWQCTKNMKEQYKHRNCILSYTSMPSSPTWMCVSSKNHITHVLGLHRENDGKSTKLRKVNKCQQVPKATSLPILHIGHYIQFAYRYTSNTSWKDSGRGACIHMALWCILMYYGSSYR